MPEMLTIRVRKKYAVVSEFEVPANRFERVGLASFLRAIYHSGVISDPQELIQYFVNRRKGDPIRNSDADLQNCWRDETREIGHCCGTTELMVEAMRTFPKEQYDAFKKLRKQN